MIDNFFYPHKLFVKKGTEYIFASYCNDQPNRGNGSITTPDRVNYIFKSLIFLPNESDLRLKPGQEIQVSDCKGVIRFTGEVARFTFDSDELDDNRCWV